MHVDKSINLIIVAQKHSNEAIFDAHNEPKLCHVFNLKKNRNLSLMLQFSEFYVKCKYFTYLSFENIERAFGYMIDEVQIKLGRTFFILKANICLHEKRKQLGRSCSRSVDCVRGEIGKKKIETNILFNCMNTTSHLRLQSYVHFEESYPGYALINVISFNWEHVRNCLS